MNEIDINSLVEFAENIFKIDNTNIIQKRNGLNNLLKKTGDCISDVLTFINNNIKDFVNWRYRDYYNEIYTGYGLYAKKKMLQYVNDYIKDITEYEKDTEEDLKVRKVKLQERTQVVSIEPTYKRVSKYRGETGPGVHYDAIEVIPHPDIIYVQTGIYRKYWEYRTDQLFIFALNLYRTFNNYKFMKLCDFTFLYIALKNELQRVDEEMELLGIRPHLGIKDANASKQVERILNEEALKKYFVATFKGAGNNNTNYFDYLIEDIKPKDAARMALIIYGSDKMIRTQKPNTFKEWYRLFCEMAGYTYSPEYKPSNLDTNNMKRKLSYL
jgi:hypothetical protein